MTEATEKLLDAEIIEKVLAGNKAIYEVIVRRYNPYLYKVGRSYNYNHEDTQDLMQDTYVDAYKSLSQFEQRSNFKTWLIRIMLNNCYRKREKLSYKNEFAREEVNERAVPMFSAAYGNTQKEVQTKELGNILEKSISKLSEEYRMVFSLREINGLNVAETAELLNISESNVKVRLNRAKAMLKTDLEKSYNVVELFEFNLVYCKPLSMQVMQKIESL